MECPSPSCTARAVKSCPCQSPRLVLCTKHSLSHIVKSPNCVPLLQEFYLPLCPAEIVELSNALSTLDYEYSLRLKQFLTQTDRLVSELFERAKEVYRTAQETMKKLSLMHQKAKQVLVEVKLIGIPSASEEPFAQKLREIKDALGRVEEPTISSEFMKLIDQDVKDLNRVSL